MIVGIDCYHDTTAGKRSIGALVASLNQTMSRLVLPPTVLLLFALVLTCCGSLTSASLKVVLSLCPAAERSGDHGWTEEALHW